MGLLDDVMKTLDRIPIWKRLQTLPPEVDALTKRVAALEARLAPATGDQCPKCRAMTFKLDRTEPEPEPWGSMGAMQTVRRCSSCNYERIDKQR